MGGAPREESEGSERLGGAGCGGSRAWQAKAEAEAEAELCNGESGLGVGCLRPS